VKSVPPNVIPVRILPIIVSYVLQPEFPTQNQPTQNQPVDAPMANMMILEFVLYVIINENHVNMLLIVSFTLILETC
jgi:hypothetical protein